MAIEDIEDGFEIVEAYYDDFITKQEAIYGLTLLINKSDTKAHLKMMRNSIRSGEDRETAIAKYQR